MIRLALYLHRVVPSVLPLGQFGVIAKFRLAWFSNGLDVRLDDGLELRVVSPHVVQDGAERVVSFRRDGASRETRARLHIHLGVKAPHELESGVEFTDG